jgi:hypothetical protein
MGWVCARVWHTASDATAADATAADATATDAIVGNGGARG